ncbi:MAG: VWA domain-containing protein [Myxococcota bacterium]
MGGTASGLGGLGTKGTGAGGGGAADGFFQGRSGGGKAANEVAANQPAAEPAKPTSGLEGGLVRETLSAGDAPADTTTSAPMRQKKTAKLDDLQARRADLDNADDDEAEPAEVATATPAVPTPVYDWGATVYLSNDDSMSLASAQRVLYATARGVPLSPSEVRPHELLNYFSFDSAAPAPDRTFGVLGAAERDGDTLTVSLAVRGANPPRQPLDLTVLLDRSGSMAAEGRMDYTRRGLSLLSDNLQRGDRLDLVLFDGEACTPVENFVVGRDDPALVEDVIRQMAPRGSTDLDAGLQEAYRIQTSRDAGDVHGRNRRVLLVTDAELNTGNVSEALVSEVGRHLDENGVHLSGVGVGRDFNDHMLDLLTEKGKGAYVYLGSEAVVDRIFGPGFDSLVRTVAHDVQFSLDLPESLAMAKFYGEEASTNAEDVDPIHYHAGTTQLFLQDLAIRDGQLADSDPIVMHIAYRDAITGEPSKEELRTTVGALLDGDRHNLRKGRALMAFSDWVMAGAMGADACGAPLDTYRERADWIGDDAEIGFVNGLVGQRCGVALPTVAVAEAGGVALKVRVDADIPIGRVELQCGARSHLETLTPADTIATFSHVQPGACTLKLDGTTPMAAAVEVPPTDADLRCIVRGGRVSCT